MRGLWLLLDSVGCGGAADAADFGDAGADTLGHLFEREGLKLPNMASLGLYEIMHSAVVPEKVPLRAGAAACRLSERSIGKDTTTGHWELAGVVLEKPFETYDCFFAELVSALEHRCGVRFLGNVAASGTEILERLGEEHCRSGSPILYTSADSVMQIAAHEEIFGLERLLEVCRQARGLLDERGLRIGRVIARPFVGNAREGFRRTANRRDFSLEPPRMVLDELKDAGVRVCGVGKISDIFAGHGLSESHPTKSNAAGMEVIARLWAGVDASPTPTLIVANLVDFDMLYGHRRDPQGYARALREFDAWLGGWLPQVREGDFVCITADHGNDPYHQGTDHTREQVPLLTLHSPLPVEGERGFSFVAELLRAKFGVG